MEGNTPIVVEKEENKGSWNALWALGGFAAGYLVNGGRCGNGWGCGNSPAAAFVAGEAAASVPYGAASASAIYQQGIMEGKNTCGIDYIAQQTAANAAEMRNGFAQVNAQFVNILDREYQKLLAENTSLRNGNALCAAVSPINSQLQALNGQVSCIRDAQGPAFFWSKNTCGNNCGCNNNQ